MTGPTTAAATVTGGGARIGWCTREEVGALQAFMDLHWQRGHVLARDADLLRWQYRHPGGDDRLAVLVAREAGEILGFLGHIPTAFSRYGERVPGVWLAMWSTAPDARSRRVGLSLLREALAGPWEIVAAVGFNDSVARMFGVLGFDVRDAIPRWVRVVSPAALESLLGGESERYPAQAWAAWRSTAAAAAGRPSAAVRVREWNGDVAARWDLAWRERFAPRLVGTWRDAAYLGWRYVEHPRFQYVIRAVEDRATGALTGLLVYRVEVVRDRPEKVLRVVELLAEESSGGALAGALLEAAEAAGVAFADFACASDAWAAPLEAAGFAREDRLPAALPSLFQPLDLGRTRLTGGWRLASVTAEETRAFFATAALYVTRSDGDQDRPN